MIPFTCTEQNPQFPFRQSNRDLQPNMTRPSHIVFDVLPSPSRPLVDGSILQRKTWGSPMKPESIRLLHSPSLVQSHTEDVTDSRTPSSPSILHDGLYHGKRNSCVIVCTYVDSLTNVCPLGRDDLRLYPVFCWGMRRKRSGVLPVLTDKQLTVV